MESPSSDRPHERVPGPAPGRDPRRLGEILEELLRVGPSTLEQLSSSLTERAEVRVAFTEGGERERRSRPADVDAILRELAFVGWVEAADRRWALTSPGETQARSGPVAAAGAFALALCEAHEERGQHVVSRLLGRLWDLSPERQGAVVLELPKMTDVPANRPDLVQWLKETLPPWTAALDSQTRGLLGPVTVEDLEQRMARSLLDTWDALTKRDQRKRLKEVLSDRLLDLLFGAVVTPRDFWVWQTRMDWAGLTLLARQLPGVRDRVWFPVGAFRREGNPSFLTIPRIARDGLAYHVFAPSGPEAEERFASALYDAYARTRKRERVEYVSLLSIRDQVCFQLRIGNGRFEDLLQRVFPRALQGDLPYSIALEVDLSPTDRRKIAGQLPVIIDHTPRYILSMRRR